jgi:hypothetical protein
MSVELRGTPPYIEPEPEPDAQMLWHPRTCPTFSLEANAEKKTQFCGHKRLTGSW